MTEKLLKESVRITKKCPLVIQDTTFFAGESFFPHTHDFFEFILIYEGNMQHLFKDESQILVPRDLFLICPEDQHTLRAAPDSGRVSFYNVCFTTELMSDVLGLISSCFKFEPDSEVSERLAKLNIQEYNDLKSRIELQREYGMTGAFTELRKSQCYSMLMDVLTLIEQSRRRTRPVPPEWLVKARDKMRQKVNLATGIDAFIKLSGRSREHLSRSMKKYYNETPQEYINRLKVQDAAKLLCSTRMSIDQVMFESGFRNLSYFRRCFKKNFSITPGRYRRQALKIYSS